MPLVQADKPALSVAASLCAIMEGRIRNVLASNHPGHYLLAPSDDYAFLSTLTDIETQSRIKRVPILPPNVAFSDVLADSLDKGRFLTFGPPVVLWAADVVSAASQHLLAAEGVQAPPLFDPSACHDADFSHHVFWSSVAVGDVLHARWLLRRMSSLPGDAVIGLAFDKSVDCLDRLRRLIVCVDRGLPRDAAVHFAVIMGVCPHRGMPR